MSIGERIYDALLDARKRGETLSRERWIAIANITVETVKQEKKRKPQIPGPRKAAPRNDLFDALAKSTGTTDLGHITRMHAKTIGVALAEIKEVSPDLTSHEIQRVVDAYRKKHPTWPCTAMAIAKHWAEFARCDRTETAKTDVYQEPKTWKTSEPARLKMGASPETWQVITERNWFDLAVDIRADILAGMNR